MHCLVESRILTGGDTLSLRLIRAVARTERADELHLARLLILLQEAGGKTNKPVDGIMKLAKLDFLLRYPNCLERALQAAGKNPSAANVQQHERNTVETKMMRFRYGPWDGRYRRWIGLLLARDLAVTYMSGRTVCVALTDKGRAVAAELSLLDDFSDLKLRSNLIVKAVGSKSGTGLKDFIYETFPEILDMKWGDEISL